MLKCDATRRTNHSRCGLRRRDALLDFWGGGRVRGAATQALWHTLDADA